MVKEIITDLKLLEDRADEINIKSNKKLVKKIICDLKDTIRAGNHFALAAPQIGYNARIICLNFKGDLRIFINPIIAKSEGVKLSREMTPSIPGKEYIIPRNPTIICMYQTLLNHQGEANKFLDQAAFAFQQANDCLNGVHLNDLGLEIDENFDKATDEEREELLGFYLNTHLKSLEKELNKEISENEELNQIAKAAEFMEKVQTGEVTLMKK